MEDRHITESLWIRSEDALQQLSQRFGDGLHRLAWNLLSSQEDAEECVNDTYLAVWNAIPPERPEPLSSYVYAICRNIALKRRRANSALKRSAEYQLSLDSLSPFIPAAALEDTVDARDLGRAINTFLATQNTQTRIIFLRRYWFGDSFKEIAQRLGMKESAVTLRLHRLQPKLKAHLLKEGFIDAP